MKRKNIEDLKKIVATLRGPNGCPWDKKQTAQSLTPYVVEEALELEDAIHHKSDADIMDELGDVLFQVVLHSQIAAEEKRFTLDDVIDSLSRKMVARHPHVFENNSAKMNADDVKDKWEKDKSAQKDETNTFTLPKNFPALLAALKIGKKTRSINFDWDKPLEIFAHFLTETDELKQAIKKKDKVNQWEEVGDSLFTLVQVARHLSVDPEKALRMSNKKVVDRIRLAHKISGLPWKEYIRLSLDEKEALWEKAKKQLKTKARPKKKD
ncbi:MAG: nucleoside triphosphate pyrophosphohydrolase [Bdellovibrionaceae bacterium]|nr:nucleoside triphosphate pyrophosphohydrolase [Pseudobdellovibrionaceae bacterium]